MNLDWIIPFVVGVIIGQELKNIPKVKPYVEEGIGKLIVLGREISSNIELKAEERKKEEKKKGKNVKSNSFW